MLLEVAENIKLESLSVKHANKLFRLVDKNRLRLKQYLGWLDIIKTTEDEEKYINGVNINIVTNFVILFDNNIAGTIDFHNYECKENNGLKTMDIGYWLDADCEKNGIITKSCERLIQYGFNELKLDKIYIHCAVDNIKSENVAKRLNFSFVREIKNHYNLYGIYKDAKEYLMEKI